MNKILIGIGLAILALLITTFIYNDSYEEQENVTESPNSVEYNDATTAGDETTNNINNTN